MADITVDVVAPQAAPTSLAEYKAAKAAKAAPAPAAAEKPHVSVPSGESAVASEAPTQETQEKGKRDRSAEGRASELSAQGRYEEAQKILEAKDKKRDQEFAELRKKLEATQVAKPVVEPEAPKPVSQPSGEPKLKDFLAKPENKGKDYEDVVEDWVDARDSWREGKRTAAAETGKRVASFNEKIEAARAAHADYDAVTSGENFQRTLVKLAPQAVAAAAHEMPHGVEVLYQLASDPDECRRIAGLSPTSQIIELGVMSRDLVRAAKASPDVTPEKPKPPAPVSKTPPPVRSLGGIAPPVPSHNAPPMSLAEHKRRKAEQAK